MTAAEPQTDETTEAAQEPATDVVFARVFSTTLDDVLNEAYDAILTKVASGKWSGAPILTCVLLEADADKQLLHVRVTDLERRYHRAIPADVPQSRRIAVSLARLRQVLATFTEPETITLATNPLKFDKTHLIASQNRTDAWITSMKDEDYPSFGERPDDLRAVRVSLPKLREALARALPSAASDDARPVFAGVLLRVSGQELIVTAADSFRLSVVRIWLDTVPDAPFPDTIIPAETWKKLMKIVGKAGGELVIESNTVHVPEQPWSRIDPYTRETVKGVNPAHDKTGENTWLTWNGRTLIVNTINGKYPNFDAVLNEARTHRRYAISFNVRDMESALTRVSSFSKETANIVHIRLTSVGLAPEEEEDGWPVEVSWEGHAEDHSTMRTTMDAALRRTDDGVMVAPAYTTTWLLNYRYLVDLMKCITTNRVTMMLGTDKDPVEFVEMLPPAGIDFCYLVMPFHNAQTR